MNTGPHSPTSTSLRKVKAAASRRAGLLAGAATLTLVFATAAQAQVAVQAREDRDPATAIELSAGNDRLSIDISRVNAAGDLDLTGLASGINDPGGADSLWLTATGVQTRALLNHDTSVDGFESGVVYEAYGADSVLTLNSPPSGSYNQTLRLAGNGTINLAGYLSPVGTTPAIYVEALTTAGQFDGVDGRLNLILSGTVVGVDAPRLIDVANAGQVSLVGADIDLRHGTGIHADGQTITIDEDSTLRALDSSHDVDQNAVLVSLANGTVTNHGTLREMGDVGGPGTVPGRRSTGVTLDDYATLENLRTSSTDFGRIVMHGAAADLAGFRSTIVNDGHIESTTGSAIISSGGDIQVVRNGAAGVISGATNAYRDSTDGVDALIVNAGVMNGNVRMGPGDDMFLSSVNAAGQVTGVVNGLIDGGSGADDAFGLSYAAAGNFTHALPATINGGFVSGFERYGVEAFDTGTTVAITGGTAAEPMTHGLSLSGDGRIVNQAYISLTGDPEVDDLHGIILTGFFGGLDFENSGVVRTDAGSAFYADWDTTLQSFANSGELSTESHDSGVEIDSGFELATGVFDFINSGTIRSAEGIGVYLMVDNVDLDFRNTGTITGGTYGVEADAYEGRAGFSNTASITGESGGRISGRTGVAASNSGTVNGHGEAGFGLALRAYEGRLTFTNSGVVRANGGGIAYLAETHLAAGLSLVVAPSDENTNVSNAAGATIEATGADSVAVAVAGAFTTPDSIAFSLTNSGTIRGSGEDTVAASFAISGRVFSGASIASAIQTQNTTDAIINDGGGAIVGNVDLANGADRFEARGTSVLQGDLRMGSEADTLVWAGGGITGTAFGGGDSDTLLIDLSADRTINFDFFREFETVRQQTAGTTGILTASGTTDLDYLQLDGLTMRVAAGTTLASAADTSLTVAGSDNSERLIVEGAIDGDVALGGGDDRVDMAGGSISGFLDGGDGDDTLGFRIEGVATSVPMALSFETLDVVGTAGGAEDLLDVTLDSDFNAIRLREGANLTLTGGAGSAGLISGDDGAQVVTLRGGAMIGGVSLGGGSDTLNMEFAGRLSDALNGGEDANGLDVDTLNLTLTGATNFADGAVGFEQINIAGAHTLTVGGTFAAGQALNFADDDNHLVISEQATFAGSANGGDGDDSLTVELEREGPTTISGTITGFEDLIAEGTGGGVLALTGAAYAFDTVTVHGTGSLRLGAGTSLVTANGVAFDTPTDSNVLTLGAGSSITGRVDAGEGVGDNDTLSFVQNAGEVGRFGALDYVNFEQLMITGAGEFQVDVDTGGFDTVLVHGGTLVVNEGVTLSDDISGLFDADTVRVHGVLAGSISLAGGSDTVDNSGVINGDVLLGDGDDRYIARDGGLVTGLIDGGDGDNTFIFRLGGNPDASIPGNVSNFNSFGVYGAGTLNIALNAGQNYARLELLEGANLILEDNGGTAGSIIGDDSAQEVTIGTALVSGVELNGGDDTLNLTLNGALSGDLNGGDGADRMNLTLAGDSSITDMNAFEDVRVTAADDIRLTVASEIGANQSITFEGATNNHLALTAGAVLNGSVNGGDGTDRLEVETGGADQRTVVSAQISSFETLAATGSGALVLNGGAYGFNSVTSDGGLTLGENVVLTAATVTFADNADNTLVLASGADIQGAIDGGAGGLDTLSLIQAQSASRVLSSLDQTGFERLAVSGAGTLVIDEDAAFEQGVGLDGGHLTVNRGVTLTADVAGGANADVLEALGIVDGAVSLGAGDDRLVLGAMGNVTGAIDAGDGADTLALNTTGSYEAPTVFDGAGFFDTFENFEVAGGVVSLTANQSWADVNVTGGRLIGQAGTTLTSAGTIDVAAGATFGSAGIVNGDINVLGTLSPGASPGTMTVNGDVTMAAGSHLAIELTPAAGTDLLDVNGALTIVDGATMDITGALGSAAGSVLDIVVADSITGRFTTVNKSETVFGFVVQNGNRIQIRSEFNNNAAYPGNVRASVDYANQVLRASYGVQAFTSALNVLTAADGAINQRAFAELTPEAYGSAVQIGVENGLSLVDATRTIKMTAPVQDGLYAFGQGLLSGGEIGGQSDTGAVGADMDTAGFFAGLGYGMGGRAQVGAFVGKIDTDQSLEALGAMTSTDGDLVGAYADVAFGDVGVHGLVAYNDSDATTRRSLAAISGNAARGDYGVSTWTADIAVDYAFNLDGLTVTPKAGMTYVDVQRGGVVEQGAGAFALSVDDHSQNAWFADVGVGLSGAILTGGAILRPYAELGVRQMLNDADVSAVGRFAGAPGAPVTVAGVERGRTVGRYGFGFKLDVDAKVRINAGFTGEFGDADRSTFNAGMSMRF